MTPRNDRPSFGDLFAVGLDVLEQGAYKPSILNYGTKDYPEQMRFHCTQKPGRYISGGNRAGKTDAEVVEAIWWASDSHPYLTRPDEWGSGPLQIRIVAPDIEKGVKAILLPKFKRWMTSSMLIDGSWDKSWDERSLTLTFSNGSQIDFVTHTMALVRLGGVPRHMIFFDEIPPLEIFNECLQRLIDYRGWWVIAATSVEGIGWTYEELWEPFVDKQDDPNCRIALFTLRQQDNPYLESDAEDRDFYAVAMSPEERRIREGGEFVPKTGLVFPNFQTNIHKYVVDPFIPPKNWAWYSSTDQGWNNPTATLWHAVSPSGDIVTFAEHYADHMTIAEHAAVMHEREDAWGKVPEQRTGDPAMKQTRGNTGMDDLQTYAIHGIYIGVENVPRAVSIGIEKMQQYMRIRTDGKPTWTITSNCHNLIRELKKLRWASFESSRKAYDSNKSEEIHKKDDHAPDSARYFFTLMPDLSPEIEATPEGATTIHFADLMERIRADEGIQFVDEQPDAPQWEVESADVLEELW